MKQLAWKALQFCIVAAVLFSNIHWQWTPNGYAAAVVAFLAALLVSLIPIMVSDLTAFARRTLGVPAKPLLPHQSPGDRPQLHSRSSDVASKRQ